MTFSPSQIKMLKHNKYTVHLTSSQAPNCNPITFLPSTQSLFLLNSHPVSGFCASIKVRMWVHASECVYVSTLGQKKLLKPGAFGIRLSVCSFTLAFAPCPPPNPTPSPARQHVDPQRAHHASVQSIMKCLYLQAQLSMSDRAPTISPNKITKNK